MTSHRHRCLPERGPSFLWRVVGAPASHERSAYPPKPGTAGLRRPSPGSFERFGVSNYCRAARLARRAGEHSPTALGPEVRHPLLLRARPTLGSRSSGAPATRRSPRVHFEIAAGGGRGRHDTRAEEVAHGPVTRGPVVASVRMVIRADRGGAVVREAALGIQAQGSMSTPRFGRVRDRFGPSASPLPGVVEPDQSRVAATARSH